MLSNTICLSACQEDDRTSCLQNKTATGIHEAKIAKEVRKPENGYSLIPKVQKRKKYFNFATELKWNNVFIIFLSHSIGIYYILTFPYWNHKITTVWCFIVGILSGFGVTGGVHRLWSHRAYKAKLPLRIFIMMCYCSAGQNSIYDWVRDHRVHHKFSETDADPHNSKRGFFFSHVGWLMMHKHPDVIKKGREIDMSDVANDPVVAFCRYFIILKLLLAFVIPSMVPIFLWNEDWYAAIVSQCFIRYTISLNSTWSVNSFAHLWGNKPYDKNISPVQNKSVAFFAMGEGWHNYHHVFPWDYKAAELGNYSLNFTTAFIDFFYLIGWAYDCKEPSTDLVKTVAKKRGDGTYRLIHHHQQEVPAPKEK